MTRRNFRSEIFFQEQKKNYRSEKKRAAKELLSNLKDPSVIIMAEWLKVRGSLKSWTKFWCVLKPGLLLLYKSHKMKVREIFYFLSRTSIPTVIGFLLSSCMQTYNLILVIAHKWLSLVLN